MKLTWLNHSVVLRHLAILLAFAGICVTLQAQHASQYSLYMYERYAYNPAFAGMERSVAAALQYRTQWLGLEGHPEAKLINVHMPVYLWQGAIGFQILSETAGAGQQTSFAASYNYIRETNIGLFSTGIRAGIQQMSLDGSRLRTPDGTYEGPIIDHHDIVLPNGRISGIAPLLEAGLYFAGDAFEAGVSMTGWYPAGIKLDDQTKFNPKPVLHFFGEYFVESFDEVSLYPALYIKSDGRQTQAEVSLRADWQNLLSAGLGYRGFGNFNTDAILLSAGVRLSPKFFLYYGYDIGLSQLQVAHEGSHELLVKYNLGKRIGAGLPPRIIYNPRNL